MKKTLIGLIFFSTYSFAGPGEGPLLESPRKKCEVVCSTKKFSDHIPMSIWSGIKTVAHLGGVVFGSQRATCSVIAPGNNKYFEDSKTYAYPYEVGVSAFGNDGMKGYWKLYKNLDLKQEKLLTSMKEKFLECIDVHGTSQNINKFPGDFDAAKVPLVIRRFFGTNVFDLTKNNQLDSLSKFIELISMFPGAVVSNGSVLWSSQKGAIQIQCGLESCQVMVKPGKEVVPETYDRRNLKFLYRDSAFGWDFLRILQNHFGLIYDKYDFEMNGLKISFGSYSYLDFEITPNNNWINSKEEL